MTGIIALKLVNIRHQLKKIIAKATDCFAWLMLKNLIKIGIILKGMDDEQVFDFLKSDMTWHKPTQSFSSSDNFFKVLWNNTLKDEFDKTKLRGEYNHMNQFKFDANDIKAFSILGVSVGLKWEQIQDKFKTLVKKFHPDINLGNKEYEEKLKLITLAYTQLKNTYREKIDT